MSAELKSLVPGAMESERAALGAVLVDEKHMPTLLALVRVEDFFLSSHREILRAIICLQSHQKAVDLVTVTEELQRTSKLDSVGGAAYLASLIDGLPDRPNIETYAQNIRDTARARQLHAAATATCIAIEQGEPVDQVLAHLQERQSDLSCRNATGCAQKLFVPAPQFVAQAPKRIDWLVEGVIERGANGFFSGAPKGGKSWAAVDLAISLALGCDWLGFRVPGPVKVALISREDNPSLTAWRIGKLFRGKSCATPSLLETNLYVNSRRETAELMLDNPSQMAELMSALKTIRPQFAIFDVFNVLHSANENDNQEMRTVLRQLSAIQAEIGCGIGVVHHYNKTDQGGSMTQRLRGSSAIAGWAEWLIGISMEDEKTKTRRMEFELKAAQPPEPICYRTESMSEATRLERVRFDPRQHSSREGSAAARLMQ